MPSTRSQATSATNRPVKWNRESDRRLMNARREGMGWQVIADLHFPGQSHNACRKRYERVIKEMKREELGGPRLQDLAVEYEATREKMWSILAERLDERWEVVEAKCMEKGVKQLTTIARSARRHSAHPSASLPPRAGDHAEPHAPCLSSPPQALQDQRPLPQDPLYLHAHSGSSPGQRSSSHRRNVSGSSGSSGSQPRSAHQHMHAQHQQQRQHQHQQHASSSAAAAYASIHAAQAHQQYPGASNYDFVSHPAYYLSAQVAPPPPVTRSGGMGVPAAATSAYHQPRSSGSLLPPPPPPNGAAGMGNYAYSAYMPTTTGAGAGAASVSSSSSSYGNIPPLNSMLQQPTRKSR